MILKIVKIHKIKNSFVIYLPITWARNMKLENGDKMIWSIDEGQHDILNLEKENGGI
jgi:hypothetical protein